MSMTEYPCNECGLPGVNRVFDGGGTAYIHHRCPAKTCFLCGQMEITDMVGHLCPKIEEKDMATANTPETCPCANWSWVVGEYHDRTKHHPNCDGHGKPKTHFVTGMSVAEKGKQVHAADGYCETGDCAPMPPESAKYEQVAGMRVAKSEPSLSLLVIDVGDCCLVKVEKGEWKRSTVTLYRGSATITLPFQRLREELDGVKPKPPYFSFGEKKGQFREIILNSWGYTGEVTDAIFHACQEFAGRELKVHDVQQGTWEELGHIDDQVYNNTDLRVWRYRRA